MKKSLIWFFVGLTVGLLSAFLLMSPANPSGIGPEQTSTRDQNTMPGEQDMPNPSLEDLLSEKDSRIQKLELDIKVYKDFYEQRMQEIEIENQQKRQGRQKYVDYQMNSLDQIVGLKNMQWDLIEAAYWDDFEYELQHGKGSELADIDSYIRSLLDDEQLAKYDQHQSAETKQLASLKAQFGSSMILSNYPENLNLNAEQKTHIQNNLKLALNDATKEQSEKSISEFNDRFLSLSGKELNDSQLLYVWAAKDILSDEQLIELVRYLEEDPQVHFSP